MVAIGVILLPGVAFSNQEVRPAWFERPYQAVVVDQAARDVLSDLSRNLNVPVIVGDAVKARVHGQISAGTTREFLQQLSSAVQLAWYFDGSVLHVDNQSELQTEVIDVSNVGAGAVKRMLPDLGVMGEGVTARLDGEVLRVSGPPAFVALVHKSLAVLHVPERETEVRVFKGGVMEVVKDLPATEAAPRHFQKTHGSIVAISSRPNL
jgi:type III secretion protein C